MQPAPIQDSTIAMAPNDAVRELERYALELPQVDLATSHVIHGGMYARTILIPAGTLLTGALTNCDNICICAGDITVTTDEGAVRLTGYHVIPASKGMKRAGIAHADTYWTTLIPTQLVTVEQIEAYMTDEADMLQTRREGIEYVEPMALKGE